jgi:hypothetical protein
MKKSQFIIVTALLAWLSISIAISQTRSSLKVKVDVKSSPKIYWETFDSDTVNTEYNIYTLNELVNSYLPLVSVELYLNDILIDKYTNFDKIEEKSYSYYQLKINRNIEVRNGGNIVKFVAVNDKKQKTTSYRTLMSKSSNLSVLQDNKDRSSPSIYLSNPANIRDDNVRYSKGLIDIRGTVIDDFGVNKLVINGINTPIKTNGIFVINIPLSMGNNPISMEATDINGNVAIKRFTIIRKDLDGEEYIAEQAKNHLLLVGINEYQNWPQLNNAVADAEDLRRVLTEKYTFSDVNTTILTNAQADRNTIYNTLRDLIGKVGPQDNLMVYFSGHGYYDELLDEGYWIPVDAQAGDLGDYLPNSTILKLLKGVNSQHTFLVADACFSGSLFSQSSRGYAENVEKYRSRWGLASGRLETVSDGAIGQNSPFAATLLNILNNNDKDKFSVSELVQKVKIEVANISDQTPIGNPLKSIGDEGGEFIFYLKK